MSSLRTCSGPWASLLCAATWPVVQNCAGPTVVGCYYVEMPGVPHGEGPPQVQSGRLLDGESTSRGASQAGGEQRRARHWSPTSLLRRKRGEMANSKLFSPPSDSDGGEIWLRIGRCICQAPALRDAGDRPARGRVASVLHLCFRWSAMGIRAGIRWHSRHISRGIRGHSRAFAAFALDCPCGESLETLGFSYVSASKARHEKFREQPPFKILKRDSQVCPGGSARSGAGRPAMAAS